MSKANTPTSHAEKTISCWVIDDEPAAHQGIDIALQKHRDFCVTHHAYKIGTALIQNKNKPDVIFLDIEMPGNSGFALFDIWPEPLPLVVFITAYNHFAVQAFDHNALDYLLKPIEQSRFDSMTIKVRKRLMEAQVWMKKEWLEGVLSHAKLHSSQLGLSVKTDDGLLRLKQKNIIFIESVGDHIGIHCCDNQQHLHTLITRDTLKRLATELDTAFFFRTHKSFMVNSAHVTRIERGRFGDGIAHLSHNKQVKISRRYRDILAVIDSH